MDPQSFDCGKDSDPNGPLLKGLTFKKSNVIDFWSVRPSAVQTKETSSERLGWLQQDDDSTWFAALESAALTLIMGYVILAKGVQKEPLFHGLLKSLIRKVQTFGFGKLTEMRKLNLVFSLPTGKEEFGSGIAIHEYESDVTLASSSSPVDEGCKPDAAACDDLFGVAAANKAKHDQAAQEEDARIMQDLASVTAEILTDAEYGSQSFCLDSIRPPCLENHIADAIGFEYSRAQFAAKHLLHVDLIKLEIKRINTLVA